MKRKHKFTKILSLTMMLVLTLSLFSPVEASAAVAKKPVITATQTVVSKGTTTQLKASYDKKNVTTAATWKSSNTKVATVSKKGVLTAKTSGVTYVTAKYKGKTSNKVKITVTQTKLSKTSISLAGGKKYTLTTKYNGKTVKPSYKSSNTKIATVDKNGKITAVAKGSATITASYKGTIVTCKVTVTSNAHTHKYTATVTTKATCTKDGIKTYKCSCGKTYTEKLPATGHKYDNGVITTEPTCTETGVKTFTCSGCGDTYTEIIPATGSDNDNNNQTPIEPTEPEPPTCEHEWVEVTETIHHDEVGHYETIIIEEAYDEPVYESVVICGSCGKDFGSGEAACEAALDHTMEDFFDNCENYHTEERQVGTKHHDAVTEQKWVVDQKAYDETVKTGHKCSVCGATK